MDCVYCDSDNVIKNGTITLTSGKVNQKYFCKDCGSNFRNALDEDISIDEQIYSHVRSDSWIKSNVLSKKKLVITSAQNNTEVNKQFLKTLKTYCLYNNANLVIIPVKYKVFDDEPIYDDLLTDYLCSNNIDISDYTLKIYGSFNIQPTVENPITGLDTLSKGNNIVIGHPQVQLKTLPNLDKRVSDIITTTGSVTLANYSDTKVGEKAKFNHSFSAIVLEFDTNSFHLRHLNWDDQSKTFYDLNKLYSDNHTPVECHVNALVTGDEHALFRDSNVEYHTYTSEHSLVSLVRPEYIVRHDILDAYSISHHHKKNVFTQYAKWKSNICSIEDELRKTISYVNETTPSYSTSLIVQSNHNEHLLRWLNEVDIKTEPWNAKLFHYLMYQMLEKTSMAESGASYPDPFELIAADWLNHNVKFINRSGFKINDIEIGQHGDIGINCARGSSKGFARMPDKMIVGHSHSPSIEKGCYTVGTSSKLRLEYNKGASSWHHAHVIIHPNGKRQMIFITEDGFKLK